MVYFYDYTAAAGGITRWYTAAEVDPGNTGTGSIHQTTPLTPGIYAWIVSAQNVSGSGPWSVGMNFTVP
jgi:hypothetical protein